MRRYDKENIVISKKRNKHISDIMKHKKSGFWDAKPKYGFKLYRAPTERIDYRVYMSNLWGFI